MDDREIKQAISADDIYKQASLDARRRTSNQKGRHSIDQSEEVRKLRQAIVEENSAHERTMKAKESEISSPRAQITADC